MVGGDISGVKNSLLQKLEALYELEFDQDQCVPAEIAGVMAEVTAALGREIAVYIDRRGTVLEVSLGAQVSVGLKAISKRRGDKRLCGVRLIHTHPGGSAQLSMVDIQALKSLRFDAMIALGITSEGVIAGVGAGFLTLNDEKQLAVELEPVVSMRKVPQAGWMARIREIDALVAKEDIGTTERAERALLVGLDDSDETMEELKGLVETAGGVVVESIVQRRDKPETATYIGQGKAEEIALLAQALDVDVVITDDALTPVQGRNLENALGVKVVDRTGLILDIFAQRAATREGQLQVLLAQLKYRMPRLVGSNAALSRLGGGIGTRGPGETKLEEDRRRIRKSISDVENEIDQLKQQRDVRRAKRMKNQVPVVAIVGYTNAGKSTLLNRLTDAGVLAEDKLFATLDPVTRSITLPKGTQCLLVDTVGFIRKLPHELVNAFRSTLEEALVADVLLVMTDAASPVAQQQHDTVNAVLEQLGAGNKSRLEVINKADRLEENPALLASTMEPLLRGLGETLYISARTGKGVEALLEAIEARLNERLLKITALVPYDKGQWVAMLHAQARVLETDYEAEGTRVVAEMEAPVFDKLRSVMGEVIQKTDGGEA